MYPHPVGYPQSFPQHNHTQGSQYTGPPPAKKSKGNPIITRYPPPPGYKGPAQHQAPSQTPTWSQPSRPYGYGQPNYAGYPQQPYIASQPYQQPQWSGYQQPSYPAHTYASQPGYYPGYAAPPAWQQSTPAPQDVPPQSWQAPAPTTQQNKRRHNSAPFPPHRNSSVGLLDGNGDPYPPQQGNPGAADDLEDDYEGECYFARHPDEIDPAFSLGLIEWQAALPTKRALPSTFQEAELEALAPRHSQMDDDESISEYFTKSRREEVFLSVRQTETWEEVKHDLIFRELPSVCEETLSMSELIEIYRDRPDLTWTAPPDVQSATPTPYRSRPPTPIKTETNSDSLDIDSKPGATSEFETEHHNQSDVLGNLEQALLSREDADGLNHDRSHSRAASVSSQYADKLTRPKPLVPFRDRTQEDILAALGVTGSPKLVYQTPGPAFGPAPPKREGSVSSTGRHNSMTSSSGGLRVPPPPPPMQQHPSSYDLWGLGEQHHTNGYGIRRPDSSASQHTAAGSDFHVDDNDATPRPHPNRADGRKRGFDDSEENTFDDRSRLDEDATPKQRRKQPRVNGAYSRRW